MGHLEALLSVNNSLDLSIKKFGIYNIYVNNQTGHMLLFNLFCKTGLLNGPHTGAPPRTNDVTLPAPPKRHMCLYYPYLLCCCFFSFFLLSEVAGSLLDHGRHPFALFCRLKCGCRGSWSEFPLWDLWQMWANLNVFFFFLRLRASHQSGSCDAFQTFKKREIEWEGEKKKKKNF